MSVDDDKKGDPAEDAAQKAQKTDADTTDANATLSGSATLSTVGGKAVAVAATLASLAVGTGILVRDHLAPKNPRSPIEQSPKTPRPAPTLPAPTKPPIKKGKDPREPEPIVAGNDTPTEADVCDPEPFARDAKPEDIAKAGAAVCEISLGDNGSIIMTGRTAKGPNGEILECFTQPQKSLPHFAIKLLGEGSINPDIKDEFILKSGKVCAFDLDESDAPLVNRKNKIRVVDQAEAPIEVRTNGKVMVAILTEKDEQGTPKHFAIVSPAEGESMIVQNGRGDRIFLKHGQRPLKVPLDIAPPDTGCIIAVPSKTDPLNGAEMLLYAITIAGIFRMLKRKKNTA